MTNRTPRDFPRTNDWRNCSRCSRYGSALQPAWIWQCVEVIDVFVLVDVEVAIGVHDHLRQLLDLVVGTGRSARWTGFAYWRVQSDVVQGFKK